MGILGYMAVLCVGIILAVLGGGGSILTVPILVYLFKLPADTSTSYSLFLVGTSAALGAFRYNKEGLIAYKIGTVFTVPSFLGVFATRKFLMPAIPPTINLGAIAITKDQLILLVFAIIMLLASISMIRPRKNKDNNEVPKKLNLPIIAIEGLVVGCITGFVGAGGGFLIIPALVILAGLPIRQAIATSLMIIAIKSLLGFTGDIGNIAIDWGFLLTISAISLVGIAVGGRIAKYIDATNLKPLFGYFVLVMGIGMILQQMVF